MVDSFLSRLGIGSAEVDLKLPQKLRQGETATATVEVKGGKSDQEVEGIYAKLRTGEEDETTTIHDWNLIDERFVIRKDTEKEFEVDIYVPKHTPATTIAKRGDVSVWIDTGLEIDMAVDPDDRDYIEVEPGAEFGAFHEALTEELDFKPHFKDIEETSEFGEHRLEVEYTPNPDSEFDGTLDEIEAILKDETDNGISIELTFDWPGEGMLEREEDHETIEVRTTETREATQQIKDLVEKLEKEGQ